MQLPKSDATLRDILDYFGSTARQIPDSNCLSIDGNQVSVLKNYQIISNLCAEGVILNIKLVESQDGRKAKTLIYFKAEYTDYLARKTTHSHASETLPQAYAYSKAPTDSQNPEPLLPDNEIELTNLVNFIDGEVPIDEGVIVPVPDVDDFEPQSTEHLPIVNAEVIRKRSPSKNHQ
ncbi:MAG: hypothetical protein OEM52_02075 [bacterium]|nr:hypothetical protein [bacterium]